MIKEEKEYPTASEFVFSKDELRFDCPGVCLIDKDWLKLDQTYIHKDDHKKLSELGWVKKSELIDDIKCLIKTFSGDKQIIIDSIIKLLGDEDETKV